ncbi:hypothetical protein [Streptomyces sp. CAS3]
MTAHDDSTVIHICHGPGGEVDVTGEVDAFAREVLVRAGFLITPALRGEWIRLPFDRGAKWENEHATWAADMLTAARYPVRLGSSLHAERPGSTAPTSPPRPPVMAAQAPPARGPRR